MAVAYFFAQMIGAVLGYRLLQAITPSNIFKAGASDYGFCATGPQSQLGAVEVFIVEYIATAVLISICCGLWDPRNAKNQDSVALKFGFSIFVLSLIFVSFNFKLINLNDM